MKRYNWLCMWGMVAVLAACGQSTSNETANQDEVIEAEAPSDSTGANTQVSVSFHSTTDVAALSLADGEQAPTLAVNDSVTLTMARFNIAAIKVKAAKDVSAKEKKADDAETAEETEAVKEIDDITAQAEKSDDAIAALHEGHDHGVSAKDDSQGVKDKLAERQKSKRDKLAEHKDDLKQKEEGRLEKEVKKDRGTRFSGPYVYDAIAGKMEGTAPAVDLTDGSYRRVEFKLKRNFTAENDDPLLGQVFVIQGTVKQGETYVPFTIDWHAAMNFRLRGDGAFAAAPEEANELAIVFDLVKWFEGVDLTKLEADTTGVILVDKSHNQDVLKAIRSNIKKQIRFGKDKNKDDTLKGDEVAGSGEDVADDASGD